MRFELPYPDKLLWPNARTRSHQFKAAKVRKARSDARIVAMSAGAGIGAVPGMIAVTYHPKPSGPAPDLDNCIASFKAYRDGIADAFGTDDRAFAVTVTIGARKPRGGVTVEIGGVS